MIIIQVKKLIFILLWLVPIISFAQDDVYSSLVKEEKSIPSGIDTLPNTKIILKDNSIMFEKTYYTNLTNQELKEKLKIFMPSVKSFQLTSNTNQNSDQFSGRLNDFVVNYRKYGGTLMGTSGILNFPINANVIIQIKEGRYRVTVSEIIFKSVKIGAYNTGTDIVAEDMFTRAKRSKIRDNDTALKAANYISKDFSDSFDINSKPKINNDF